MFVHCVAIVNADNNIKFKLNLNFSRKTDKMSGWRAIKQQ